MDNFDDKRIADDLERDHLFRGTVWSLVALIAVMLGVAGYWAMNGGEDESLAERPPGLAQPYMPPDESAPAEPTDREEPDGPLVPSPIPNNTRL